LVRGLMMAVPLSACLAAFILVWAYMRSLLQSFR
jgi:hypothetical protein